jgi:hypothetical protein
MIPLMSLFVIPCGIMIDWLRNLTGIDHETNKSNLYFIVHHIYGEQVHPPG